MFSWDSPKCRDIDVALQRLYNISKEPKFIRGR